tara:strand:- start:49 stop:408 length:360 start_codon:yes stop_codon:yes gene_type:complete
MATLTLTFTTPLNDSCQVGDTAYYVATVADGGFTKNDGSVVEIGQIRQITNRETAPVVVCATVLPGSVNNDVRFVLFSKDNKANLSSILGYFASVKMVNDSTSEAELYSIGMEAFESSK